MELATRPALLGNAMRDRMARGMIEHASEEMAILAGMLPELRNGKKEEERRRVSLRT